ncbi:hypothetical protein K470DRAFT_258608 [Piedraia hortae CBS 480.64]|uniref:F-box domain-containing protein n=1 Tax=Piedraia hortae CBS 480.64 TaxID=1314780 RepID=A0A6A7BWN1_9PEZI|nr:hypothetical protein K470DRAFT_258608 [Piedraia hortae CBS 480.64]
MSSIQDHHERNGRAYYKSKDFRKALHHFDRAIDRGATVRLLDQRAACHEKLNNLAASLKDAKAAIQLRRDDATGYIRAGHVLHKMGKPKVALEVYTHGLRSIKLVGQGYERLRNAHDGLESVLVHAKKIDPLSVLPVELVASIFARLSFKQVVKVRFVSKQWANFIHGTPMLWRHLDLSEAKRKVRSSFISRAINSARGTMIEATLGNLYDPEKALQALTRLPSLRSITLLGMFSDRLTATVAQSLNQATALRSFRIASSIEVGCSDLGKMVSLLSKLEVLECTLGLGFRSAGPGFAAWFPNLRALSLTLLDCPNEALFLETVGSLPALEHLSVIHQNCTFQSRLLARDVDLSGLANLKTLELKNLTGCGKRLKLPTTIKKLTMTNAFPNFTDSNELHLPHLEELDLDSPVPANASLPLFLDLPNNQISSTPLSSLVLRTFRVDEDRVFSHHRLRSLCHLSYESIPRADDDSVGVILSRLTNLRIVDFSRSAITGVSVRALVRSGHVRHIILRECTHVRRDAVDWARSQGITVEHSVFKEPKGGRKVLC